MAAQAALKRDQRFQDQMIRDALWTASRPLGADSDRIFRSPSRRGRNRLGLAIGATVLLLVLLGAGRETWTKVIKAMPIAQRPLPPAATVPSSNATPPATSTVADPSSGLATAVASPVTRPAAAARPMPPIDRFSLRRADLLPGETLDLVVSWQPPDGARRAAAMDAFIVSRNAARQRTPLLERWSVFPGESTLPLALPAGLLPGKYELETVWTLDGGEAREQRTNFTVAERPAAASGGMAASLPQAPAAAAVATVVSSAPPIADPTPAPPVEPVAASDRVAPAAPAAPPIRSRAPAAEPLYTGG